MKSVSTIIFWTAIGLLLFWILSATFFQIFGLEFIDQELEDTFYGIRFWGVPICILLTLFGTFKLEHSRSHRITIFSLTVFVAMFSFFFMTLAILSDMCSWTDRETLFVNKEDKSAQIIKREYGCGAWDSDAPMVKDFRVRGMFWLL